MSLADTIRNGIGLANSITRAGKLQETFTLRRWNGQSDSGMPTYAASLTLQGLVEHRRRRIRTDAGAEIVSTTQVTLLEDIPALSPTVAQRKGTVDERDKILMADGSTGPIIGTDSGLVDPATTRGYMTQIFLG